MKTRGTNNNNNAATAKATRDNSSRGEVTTDPAAKTSIEVKAFARAATTLATTAPDDGTMVRAETLISTSRAGVLRREYRLLCAAVTRHETDCQSLSSPLLHSTLIAAGTQQGYVNREYANQDDRRQQQQHRRRRPGDDEGRPRVFKPDWMCPRGCGVVFGSKSNCFKCGSPREAGVDEVPADVIYGGVVAGKYDWVCNVLGCRSVNFARRSVCFTCLVPKGPLATKVDQSDRPGGAGMSGDLLANRFDPARARQASDAAAAAAWGAAAATGQQSVDATANAAWAPKEFNETADATTAGLPGHDQTAVEPAAVDPGLVAHQAQQQYAQQQYAQQPGSVAKDQTASKKKRRKEPALPGAIEDAAGGAAAVAALEQSGYVYDPDTGYYKDEASGMWYDANSGLSYHAESAAWYKWNAETNAYEPAAAGGG